MGWTRRTTTRAQLAGLLVPRLISQPTDIVDTDSTVLDTPRYRWKRRGAGLNDKVDAFTHMRPPQQSFTLLPDPIPSKSKGSKEIYNTKNLIYPC